MNVNFAFNFPNALFDSRFTLRKTSQFFQTQGSRMRPFDSIKQFVNNILTILSRADKSLQKHFWVETPPLEEEVGIWGEVGVVTIHSPGEAFAGKGEEVGYKAVDT